VGLFPPKEPSTHATALWQFAMFYPFMTPCQDQNGQKLNCFIEPLSKW